MGGYAMVNAYGAALNEGRALFAGDTEFGQWVSVSQLDTADRMERAAAMWAAVFRLGEQIATCDLAGWQPGRHVGCAKDFAELAGLSCKVCKFV